MRDALMWTCLIVLAAPASGGDTATARRSLLDTVTTPAAERAGFVDLDETDATPPPPYGVMGSRNLAFGLRTARDFDSNQDTALFAQYSYFIADDVEVGIEGAAWLIMQRDDTAAVSFSILGRYHFYQQPKYGFFVDTALGVMLSGDSVPDAGTGFNLMPRVGIGMTYKINEGGARLIYGLHWHHISNARLDGAEGNPARDAVGVYITLALPI